MVRIHSASAKPEVARKATVSLASRSPAQGVFSSQSQRIPGVSSQTFSLRHPEFFANHIRAVNHCDDLVLCMAAAHAFAAHAAIGGDDQALRRDVVQSFTDQARDLVRPLDLQGMVVNAPTTTLLSVMTWPIAGRSAVPEEQVSNVIASASTSFSTARVGW